MPITERSIVQHKEASWYGFVRLVGDSGRISVKPIVDDTPSSFYAGADFVPASRANVPWFNPRTLRHITGNILHYWELPPGEMVCEDDSVSFYGGIAFSTRFAQFG
jgi:hypothetical protein